MCGVLKKYCRCGLLIPAADKYCPTCMEAYREQASRRMATYDKTKRKHVDIYNSVRWERLTELCRSRFMGLDVWALIAEERIVIGSMSHHIVPIEDSKQKAFDISNLVYLSEGTHKRIHKLYRLSEESKRETQRKLMWCIQEFRERYRVSMA